MMQPVTIQPQISAEGFAPYGEVIDRPAQAAVLAVAEAGEAAVGIGDPSLSGPSCNTAVGRDRHL